MGASSEISFTRRLPGIAGVVAVQLLIFFILLEIIARIFDPLGISFYDETARLLDELIIEEPIGYRFPPGLEGNFYGVPVSINEHGMRDDPVPPEKEPGEFRLMAIGDSVIFSIGVTSEDSIPSRVEELANGNAPAGRYYRVLNMGVPSYNTEQELVQLEQVGLGLKPDAAFLFLIPNDLEDKMWVFEKRGDWYTDLGQRSYALGLCFVAARWVANLFAPGKQAADANIDPGDSAMADIPTSEYPHRWWDVERSLVQINRLLKKSGVPLIVFYRTSQLQAHLEKRLVETGEKYGFATAGINPWQDPRWADAAKADYINSPTDAHCNPAGCRIYAQLIYENLVSAGIID